MSGQEQHLPTPVNPLRGSGCGRMRECLVRVELPENAHALHILVHRMMNPNTPDAERNYVFSPDPTDPLAAGQTALIIRSCALPPNLAADAVDTYIPGIGETVDFLLRASPVESRKKPRPIKDERGQRKWLEAQAQKGGFFLGDFEITGSRPTWVSRPTGEGRARKWALNNVCYAGRLTVTDPEAFKHVLLKGLGREKTYGFGLLVVFPTS